MSSSREIADERLANGEIDLDEHTRLIELLAQAEEPVSTIDETFKKPPETSPSPRVDATRQVGRQVTPTLPTQSYAWLWWMLGAIGIFIWLAIINSTESTDGFTGLQEGLTIGQLNHKNSSRGSVVSLTLANTSDRVGDVLLYVSHDDIERKCEHVIEMRPGRIDRVQLNCTIPEGSTFRVKYYWASASLGIAAAAKRIPMNWDK